MGAKWFIAKEDSNLPLPVDGIRELPLTNLEPEQDKESASYCDDCIRVNSNDTIAMSICFVCQLYLCKSCMSSHKQHRCINGKSIRQERERQIDSYLRVMVNDRNREEMFNKEEVYVCAKVEVKYKWDEKNCRITGLCGLDNSKWVACDTRNSCCKVFSKMTNVLQRYIRVGSNPYDVAKIKSKQFTNDHTQSSDRNKYNSSVTTRTVPDKQCLLAITLPLKQEIWFIDVTLNPARKTRLIKMDKKCLSIDYCQYKLFTLCSENLYGSPWFVYVLSTDEGDTLNIIPTEIHRLSHPRLAVSPGRVFMSYYQDNKVVCINFEGEVKSQTTMPWSGPMGICVDRDNTVYTCAYSRSKIYRLNYNLDRYESVLDLRSENMGNPAVLCCHRGKLYFSHAPWSANPNTVTVVRVL